MMQLKFDVQVAEKQITDQLNALKDDDVMYQVHEEFARMCDPYVPMREGILAESVLINIATDGITYPGPYAHYMYMGEVYGPNIPIMDDGIIVGWFSPKNQKKHPTGRPINYNKEMHPLATKEWDKVMMANRGDEFKKNVSEILMKRFKELYG